MSATNKPRALVLVNPRAGRGARAMRGARDAVQHWRKAGWCVELHAPESRAAMPEAARAAARRGVRVVLAAGGDGTYRLVAEGLLGTETALAPLPLGSRNVLAQALGAPMPGPGWRWRWPRWLHALAQGHPCPYPVARVNGHLFLSWAGWGFDAAVVHALERARRGPRGGVVLRYLVAGWRVARKWPGFWRRDDETGPWWMGLLYQQPRYAGGYVRLPRPRGTGWWLWWVPGRGLAGLLHALRGLIRGHHAPRAYGFMPAQPGSWPFDRAIPLHVDGDPAPEAARLQWQPETRALQLWVPRGYAPGRQCYNRITA